MLKQTKKSPSSEQGRKFNFTRYRQARLRPSLTSACPDALRAPACAWASSPGPLSVAIKNQQELLRQAPLRLRLTPKELAWPWFSILVLHNSIFLQSYIYHKALFVMEVEKKKVEPQIPATEISLK